MRGSTLTLATRKSSTARTRDGSRRRGRAPPTDDERLYRVVEAMDEVAAESGKTLPQIAHLDAASAVTPPCPYHPDWNGQFAERSPVAIQQRS
jgi:hypothetical protein